MKLKIFSKTSWRSLVSFCILIAFFVFAVNSFWMLLLGLDDFVTVEELPDGRTKQTWDSWLTKTETTGKRIDGKWEGEVVQEQKTFGDVLLSRTTGYCLDGKKTGKFVTKEYDAHGEVTNTSSECYFFDVNLGCNKSAVSLNVDKSAADILRDKYPVFYRAVKAYYFENSHIKSYIDSIENIIKANGFDASEFDDYYDAAVDNLETGIYDSIWIMHDRLALLNGLDQIKQSQFRMAVIDHHRNIENSTFTIVKNSYPNYLEAINDEGASDEDFEEFCDIADSIFATYSQLNPNDHFFPDSVDIRLYRTMDIIYSNEYNPSESLVTKSAIKNNPELLKRFRENLKSRGENYSVAVDPDDMAGLVGFLMQKHYNMADKIRLAIREAYLKQGGIIDLPIAATTSGDTISPTSLNINGHVLENGGAEITGRGIAWATFYNPTVDDNFIESGFGMGDFTVNMEEMESGETYYFRSYAINSAGITYGNCISFESGATNSNITAESGFDFNIYPNPVSESATIRFRLKNAGNVNIRIIDLPGRTMYNYDLNGLSTGSYQHKINLSDFENGVYNCRILSEGKSSSKKIIVAR